MKLKLTGANEKDIPDLGKRVAYGDEFDVEDSVAESLLIQGVFSVVEEKKQKGAEA